MSIEITIYALLSKAKSHHNLSLKNDESQNHSCRQQQRMLQLSKEEDKELSYDVGPIEVVIKYHDVRMILALKKSRVSVEKYDWWEEVYGYIYSSIVD